MAENTVNQRLKILIDTLGLSVNAFGDAIGVPGTTTRNYLVRGTNPKSDFLAKVARHFEQISPIWLFTGEGDMFLAKPDGSTTQTGNFNQAGTGNTQKIKGDKNNVQNNSGDHAKITNNVKLENCKRDLATAEKELQHLRDKLAASEALVASKDVTIASKEETISVLRAAFNRPN